MTHDVIEIAFACLGAYVDRLYVNDLDDPLELDSLGRFLLYDRLCEMVSEELPIGLLESGLRTPRDIISLLDSRSWAPPQQPTPKSKSN